MGTQHAFPYVTDHGSISVKASTSTAGIVERSDDTWDAFSNDVGVLDLHLEINSDAERLQACLPAGEKIQERAELVVSIEALQSRERKEVARLDIGTHSVDVQLDALNYLGKVDVHVDARLKSGLAHRTGFAHLTGSRLAHVDAASIWMSEPPQSLGDALEIRWEDFDADGGLIDGQLFTLRLEDRPVIILNSAIPSAYSILSSKGTHGASARIRDVIFAQIVHQAWSSILSHCFLEVSRHDDDSEAETILAELDEWEAQVIRAWAPEFIASEKDPEAAARALIEDIRGTGSLVLLHQLPEVIQGKCNTISGFNGLLKDFDKFQGGS